MILHARFYLEDGAVFYANAYNHGWWQVLFSPYNGYIHLVPRLAGGVALLCPLAFAPLAESLIALMIEGIPVVLLVSPVSEKWGSLRFRAVLALLYLALPNSSELIGWITGAQWVLALCALQVVVGQIPQCRFWRSALLLLLLLAVFTGPFCLFLLPITVWMYFRDSSGWRVTVFAITVAGTMAQLVCLLSSFRLHNVDLEPGVHSFVRILAAQVYFGALLGPNQFPTRFWGAAVCMVIVGTIVLFAGFVEGGHEMRIFMGFAAAVFFASLARPTVMPPSGETQWAFISKAFEIRYWFFPCLAFTWAIASIVRSPRRYLRVTAYVLAIILVVGIARDFRVHWRRDDDCNFSESVRRFEGASKGATVVIPVFPAQDGWKAILVKH